MNFTDLLDAKGIRWQQGSKAGEVEMLCPFCEQRGKQQGTRLLLGINVLSGKGHCFHCEWASKSDAENRRLDQECTIPKVLAALRIVDRADEAKAVDEAQQPKPEVIALPDEYCGMFPVLGGGLEYQAWHYLHKRGVSDEQMRKKRIGRCLTGRYAYRVVFPVLLDGKVYGFVARDFTGRQAKPYLNSDGVKVLYNLPRRKKRVAVLFEGVMKCLAAERVLRQDADCLGVLGKSVTDVQVELLRSYKRIVVVPDNDGPGLRGSLRMAVKLRSEGFMVEIGRLNARWKDADEAYVAGDMESVKCLLRDAVPLSDVAVARLRIDAAWDYRSR